MSSGAGAQQRIAEAQQQAAQRALQFQLEARGQALGFAAESPEERALFEQQQNLLGQLGAQRLQQQALSGELRAQTLQLLRGREAAALAPLRMQQERQGRQLRNILRQRLGSGFETSTAGIEAQTRLAQAQAGQLIGTQQAAIGQLGGLGLQAQQQVLGAFGLGAQTRRGLLGARAGIQQRQIGAALAPVDFGPVIQTAGAENVGAVLRARQRSAQLGAAFQLAGAGAGAIAGGFLGGPGGAKTGAGIGGQFGEGVSPLFGGEISGQQQSAFQRGRFGAQQGVFLAQ